MLKESVKHAVTFDFDDTLSHKIVQQFAAELINKGITVWVLTSRYDDLHIHRYLSYQTNEDLYEVTDSLGIPRGRIRFQCMKPKAEYLCNTNVLWHLDDDKIEVDLINKETKVKALNVKEKGWRKKCLALIDSGE